MFEVFSILLKWLKPILLFTVLAAILSAGISLLLPNYFQSTSIFQPINPALLDRSLFSKGGSDRPLPLFGGRDDIDRIESLGASSKVINYAIDKYKLFDHYEIDPNSKNASFKVSQKFLKNYSLQKNAQGVLALSIIDKNPINAADWANDLVQKLDDLNREVIFGMRTGQIKILEKELDNKRKEMKLLNDSLNNLIKYTPTDTVQQGIVRSILKNVVDDYEQGKSSFDQTKALTGEKIETLVRYEIATPADRKIKPVRSLIVITCTLFTLAFMSFVAVFIEKFKEYQKTT